MIVAVDAVGAKHGGAARIAVDSVQALSLADDVEQVVVFTSPGHLREFSLEGDGIDVRDQPASESAAGRLTWANSTMSKSANDAGAHVILSLNAVGVADLPVVNYYQQPLLYDPSARSLTSAAVRTRLAAVRGLTSRAASAATRHIVQTSWMRGQVSEAFGLRPFDVVVAMPPPPPWTASNAPRSDDILWVGSPLGYKRWDLARWIHGRYRQFASGARLIATLREVDGEGVEAIGRVPLRDLEDRYRTAGALLVTSTCESLGLPLLEAMAAGCPIVAPDLPWARVVCDNAALYFDPDHPRGAVERLRDARQPDVLEDLQWRMKSRTAAIRNDDGWGRMVDAIRSAI